MREAMRVANHLSVDEIKMKMQMSGGFFRVQKCLVIYNALVDPRPISEIAMHTGLAEGTVQRIIAEYNALGPESLEENTKRGSSRSKATERLKSFFMGTERCSP